MNKVRAGGIAILAVVLGIALAGCGSNDKKAEATSSTSSASSSSSSAAPSPSEEAKANLTIPDYIKQQGITEAAVKRGDPGSPDINLPFPPGWEDMGAETPQWAWGAIKYTGDPAMAANPPTIIALLSKLTGNVDPAKILEYAPGEMKNLPGYEGDGTGSASTLGGFQAWQIGGSYMKDGAKRAVAQKTVVIPAADGLFVLQINADGTEDQMPVLMDATNVIDEQTTITPAS
jgi:hypothetical protein